ncbi:MAG: hypothetical protein GF368_04815 [Candidatus Aenigmarchaeota archaeon]|nr:hypothetical protein [Candidatus Aenigmarchaeota archaeon]
MKIPFPLNLCPAGLGCETDARIAHLFAAFSGFREGPDGGLARVVPIEPSETILHREPRGTVPYRWHCIAVLKGPKGTVSVFDPTGRSRLTPYGEYLGENYANPNDVRIEYH